MHFNFYNNAYFIKIPNSDKKEIYERLILKVVDNPQNREVIFLSPSNGNFNDDGGSVLSWFFYILGIGILVILFALIFPTYHDQPVKDKDEEGILIIEKSHLKIPEKHWFMADGIASDLFMVN
jgi:rhomboid protease GluP